MSDFLICQFSLFTREDSGRYFEAIEAELVYQIRTHTGKWPIYQNEIHFNNYFSEEASRIATEMFEKVYQ